MPCTKARTSLAARPKAHPVQRTLPHYFSVRKPSPHQVSSTTKDNQVPLNTYSKYKQTSLTIFFRMPDNYTIATPSRPCKPRLSSDSRLDSHYSSPPSSPGHSPISLLSTYPLRQPIWVQTTLRRYFTPFCKPPNTLVRPNNQKPALQPSIYTRPSKHYLRHLLCYYSLPKKQSIITAFTLPYPTYDLSDSWGHSLEEIDASSTFRVFFKNPNGLHLYPTKYTLLKDFQSCHDYRTAIISLPETKTNWYITDQHHFLRGILHKIWNNSAFLTSKSSESFLYDHQPGRMATIVCNKWASRLVQEGEDPLGLGRWSFKTLCGRGSWLLTIVTAYNSPYSLGDTTGYQQLSRLLSHLHMQHKQHVQPNLKWQFILDLQAWLSSLQQQGHDIILAIDTNDT